MRENMLQLGYYYRGMLALELKVTIYALVLMPWSNRNAINSIMMRQIYRNQIYWVSCQPEHLI